MTRRHIHVVIAQLQTTCSYLGTRVIGVGVTRTR